MDALKAFELAMTIPKKSYQDSRKEHIETLSRLIFALNNTIVSISNDSTVDADVKESVLSMLTTVRDAITKTMLRFEEIF